VSGAGYTRCEPSGKVTTGIITPKYDKKDALTASSQIAHFKFLALFNGFIQSRNRFSFYSSSFDASS
jgi:hypothetical protein